MTGGSWKLQSSLTLVGQNLLPNTTQPLTQQLNPTAAQSLPYGTGVGTASIIVSQSYVISAGATLTLDLYDGSLTDIAGSAAAFRLLRAYAIAIAGGGDSAGVTIGNAGSNPHPLFFGATSATKTIYPSSDSDGGGNSAGVGVAVTATVRNVKLVNNGAVPVTVSVNFAGTQAVAGVPMGLLLALTYP